VYILPAMVEPPASRHGKDGARKGERQQSVELAETYGCKLGLSLRLR
jgi:hypothetical protein